jgi:glycerol 3-phosphatase-2
MATSCQETHSVPALRGTSQPLAERYAALLTDLDGVTYRGSVALPYAVEALTQARCGGTRILFVTNNASRTPRQVAALLSSLGLPAGEPDVVTAAQAAASLAAARVLPGSAVLVVGGAAMKAAVTEYGLRPVRSAGAAPAAVVQGFAPHVDWRQLAEAAYAVATDIPWIVSNTDLAVPREQGTAPGNGTLVNAVRAATGKDPIVAGKPHDALYAEALRRARGPYLVVGDSLETDIEGAHRAGLDSVLVLTGVTALRDLLTAPARHRPTYLAADLRDLLRSQPAVRYDGSAWMCGRWTASLRDDKITLQAAGSAGAELPPSELVDGARTLCHATWSIARAGAAVLAERGLQYLLAKCGRSLPC